MSSTPVELIGPARAAAHRAARGNDQVATDFRLYVRDTIDETDAGAGRIPGALVSPCAGACPTVMPGFTHLQTGTRDPSATIPARLCRRWRPATAAGFADARKRLNESAAGRRGPRRHLVSDRPAPPRPGARLRPSDGQFLDAVSDRDFVLETLSAASICAVHLSRLPRRS